MINDLRFALRMVGTHRWFSAAIVITLALGIGVNTTVFTLVNAVLFKPVPIPNGERLVTVSSRSVTNANTRTGVSWPDFREYRANNHTFEGLEASTNLEVVVSEQGNPPERIRGARVSAGLFEMLRTPPMLGRGFANEEDKAGAEPVALLSHVVWQHRYAGAADIVGRVVRIDGVPTTIVGVMPAGFKFPSNEELWLPLVPNESSEARTNHSLTVFGLLKSGVTLDEAQRDLALIGQRISAAFPETHQDLAPRVRTFHETYNGDQVRVIFLMMLGAVGFVLLIACANVANMLLSRAVARSRELSLRAALGASRWKLIRQMLVESVLLSCLGGLLGVALTLFGVHAFDLATQDVGKPYWVRFTPDWVTFAYFAAISVASGIVFGLLPALRASRIDLNTGLKDDTRSAGSHRGGLLTGALVVLQFALTVVLLGGAGMMMRSFFAAQTMNAFIPARQILTARLTLPEGKGERYAELESRRKFHEQLGQSLTTLPGVRLAAVTSSLPGAGSGQRDIEIEGQPNPDPKKRPQAAFIVQSTRYLELIGQPVLLGRGFEELDGEPGRESAVVTKSFAAKHWPSQSALGQRFRFIQNDKPETWLTVIGVCADIIQDGRDSNAAPLVYVPYRQEPWGWVHVVLRTSADPAALAKPLRAAVQALDQDLPLAEIATLAAALERQHWFLRVFGTLFFCFAVIGLLMASVGIYAVVAQSTVRRTREIGIRMALGSSGAGIIALVLKRGLIQLLIGLLLGLGGAIATTRMLASNRMLFQVVPDDPLVFGGITTLLLIVGVLACWIPARRAAALHPVTALRHE